MKTFNVFVVMLVFAFSANAADVLTEKLQRGLFEEEANHNLDAAIKEYQSVVSHADEQRKVIATALFRLGECYRKLGRTNEANAQYERLVRDFSEQEQLVKLSRSLLPAQIPEARRPSMGVSEDHPSVKLLREEIALAEQQVGNTEKQYAAGRSTLDEVLRVKQDVLRLKRMLPENNPPAQQKLLLGEQVAIVQKLLNETQRRIEVGVLPPGEDVPLKRELLTLQRELSVVSDVATSVGAPPPEGSMTQAEAEELARVKSLAQNSPDRLEAPVRNGMSELQYAALNGNVSVAEFLLQKGVSPNGTRIENRPLLLAAKEGHLRIVTMLVEHGAKVNANDPSAWNAIMFAASAGHKSVVSYLIEHGADVNWSDSWGTTPLHQAVEYRQKPVVELLLARGAKTDTLYRGKIQLPYGNSSSSRSDPTFKGGTPLHRAAAYQFPELAELLLRAGASVGSTNYEAQTPLHVAAAVGSKELCLLFLDAGADVNAIDQKGATPLILALAPKQGDTVRVLLQKGANANQSVTNGMFPNALFLAIANSTPDVLTALLEAKADLKVTKGEGQTLLLETISLNRSVEMVESLLQAGANPNQKNLAGNLPLVQAALNGRTDMVKTLLDYKADPNATDASGQTAMKIATSRALSPAYGQAVMAVPNFPTQFISPESKAAYQQMSNLLQQRGAEITPASSNPTPARSPADGVPRGNRILPPNSLVTPKLEGDPTKPKSP